MRTSEKKTKKNEGENEHSDDEEDSNKDNKEIEEKDDENPMPPFSIKSRPGDERLTIDEEGTAEQLQLAIKATRGERNEREEDGIKKERKIKKRVKTMTITITMMKSECWRTLWKV